jgi:deazaflavin-dependent oxidoreductase (nitroreductase family)
MVLFFGKGEGDDMPDMSDFNTKIIEEFRANDGKVGGPFEGATVLLLHHKGAKSGTERVNPLAYRAVDGSWAVFGSKGGAPTNPDWYYNLRANPQTIIEVGTETIPVVAHVADEAERAPIWEAQKRDNPGFADYESKTLRQIPVILLQRAS